MKFNKLRQSLEGGQVSHEQMTPEQIEAVTGAEHPVAKQKRDMLMRIDQKIQQLQESGDEESLQFWLQKKAELEGV